MRPAIRVWLSLMLLMFASCKSPAQEDQPASPDNSAAVQTGGPTDVVGGSGAKSDTERVVPPRTSTAPGSLVSQPSGTQAEDPLLMESRAGAADQSQMAAEADKVFQLTQRVAALETEIQELQQRLRQLQDVERELANLRDAISNMKVAANDADSGRRALGAMAESPQLRGEIAEKLQGKVRLVNNTGAEQIVYINGTPWTVVEGNSYVYAPIGKVAFQRLGDAKPTFKGVQEWETNATTDEMEVVFDLSNPDSQSVVTRRRVNLDQAGGKTP